LELQSKDSGISNMMLKNAEIVRKKMEDADKAVENSRATMSAAEADQDIRHKFATMLREVKKAFVFYDYENDGILDHGRFRKCITFLNIKLSDSEWKKLMKMYDPHNKGINFRLTKIKFDREAAGDNPESSAINVMHKNAEAERAGIAEIHSSFLQQDRSNVLDVDTVDKEFRNKMELLFKENKRSFLRLDKHQTGVLDHQSFRSLLSGLNLNMADSEFKKLMRRYDPSNKGIAWRYLCTFTQQTPDDDEGISNMMLKEAAKVRKQMEDANQAVENNRATLSANEADKDIRHKFATMLREMKSAFVFYDTKNEGVLSHAKFRDAIKFMNIKLADSEWKKLMRMYDPPNKGINFRMMKLKFDKEAAGGYDKTISNVMHNNAEKERQKIKEQDKQSGENAIPLSAEEVHEQLKYRFAIATKKMQRLFKIIDTDGSGVISHVEFREALSNLNLNISPADFKKLMSKYDPDHNGMTFREFKLMFAKEEAGGEHRAISVAMHESTLVEKDNILDKILVQAGQAYVKEQVKFAVNQRVTYDSNGNAQPSVRRMSVALQQLSHFQDGNKMADRKPSNQVWEDGSTGKGNPAANASNLGNWLHKQEPRRNSQGRKKSFLKPLSSRIPTGRIPSSRVPTGRISTGRLTPNTAASTDRILQRLTRSVPIRKLVVALKHVDSTGSGKLTYEEFSQALVKIGADVSIKDRKALFYAFVDETQGAMHCSRLVKRARAQIAKDGHQISAQGWMKGGNNNNNGPSAAQHFSPKRPSANRPKTPSYNPPLHRGMLSGPALVRIKTAGRPGTAASQSAR